MNTQNFVKTSVGESLSEQWENDLFINNVKMQMEKKILTLKGFNTLL